MTEETPGPDRRRRRWITVGVLLVVVAVAGRWYWPRVDQRLVGTWELDSDSSGAVGFQLFADGTVDIAGNLKPDGETFLGPWKVEGNVLFISQQQTGYDSLREWMEIQLRSAWERTFHPAEAFARWRIVEVTATFDTRITVGI